MSAAASGVFSAFRDLREFFTLRDGERVAHEIGAAHGDARRGLLLAAQRARAAQLLWESGQRVESRAALSRAVGGLRSLLEQHPALTSVVGDIPQPVEHDDSLLDEQIDDATFTSLQSQIRSVLVVVSRSESIAFDASERRRARLQRIGSLAAIVLVSTVVAVRQWTQIKLTATASASFGAQYLAPNAVDGYIPTNWLLPDGTLGSLDVRFERRRVTKVELVNVQNMSHYGAADVTVEVYSGARLLRSFDASMRATVGTAAPTVVAVNVNEPADRVRVTIRSFHDLGGGLAEVRVR